MSIALVTGASAGIGLSIVQKLAAQGHRLALVARTEQTLRAAAASLPAGAAEIFVCDVKNLAACAALPGRVAARMGGLDVLVNNAGFHRRGPLLEVDPLDLGEMVGVNLAAPMVLTRAAAPLMPRGGRIVNVASLAGMVPMRFQVAYGATKAGLRAFSRAARDELEPLGIAVSVVSPGPVDTGFFGEELERVADIVFSQPMSTADQVADAVLECIRTGAAEIAVPWFSGKLCTLGYLSPRLSRLLRPALEKRGARNKAAYIRRKRAPGAPAT
ncbi:MAG TPA: SDR family NAD(P)-dependent oxidoreductase [Myxococcales bacterium]|jgi:short-subunit dehydrogenase|nr:SDR family NAD(P)-dependent oxidoreductase [Myxococcales bacterium]